MRISDMLKDLKAIKKLRGDLVVHGWPYDGQAILFSPKLEVTNLTDGSTVLMIDATTENKT